MQCRSSDHVLARREEQLWQRQEAMWQQQLAHWQHERSIWAQREAALLAHIQQLHVHLTETSSRTHQSPTQTVSEPIPAIDRPAEISKTVKPQVPSSSLQMDHTSSTGAPPAPEVAHLGAVTSQPSESMQATSSAASDVAVPQGPPPPLCLGSDDIYWVHQLQSGLMDNGYYSGEEEMEDIIFAEGTQTAVLAFQVHVVVCSLRGS